MGCRTTWGVWSGCSASSTGLSIYYVRLGGAAQPTCLQELCCRSAPRPAEGTCRYRKRRPLKIGTRTALLAEKWRVRSCLVSVPGQGSLWASPEPTISLTPLPFTAPLLTSRSFSVAPFSGGAQFTKLLLLGSNYLIPTLARTHLVFWEEKKKMQSLILQVKWSVLGVALALYYTEDLDLLTSGLAAGSFHKFCLPQCRSPVRQDCSFQEDSN